MNKDKAEVNDKHIDPVNLFDVDKYLSQEDDDWFDVSPLEPRNVTKPITINMIGSGIGRSYDIRGDIIPKLTTSPWTSYNKNKDNTPANN